MKAIKLRIYPTKEQRLKIIQTIGCCRKLYNEMLAERKRVYDKLKSDKTRLYGYKYKTILEIKNQFPFMKEVDSQAFLWEKLALDTAYKNFYCSIQGKHRGSRVGFPKFKKLNVKNSYRTSGVQNKIKIVQNKIKIPKVGWVKYKGYNKNIIGIIKYGTIIRNREVFSISLCIDDNKIIPDKVTLTKDSKVIGLDMSLSKFFVDDAGNSPAYEKIYKKHEKKLKKLQHILSRKKKNSNRKKKLQASITKMHWHISNARLDFTHKLSYKLVEENDVIVVESLNLKTMSQSLKLGKSVSDLGWGMFINQLKYKCDWYGKHLIEADKWFASSKICNKCGHKNENLRLKDRKWVCPNCGVAIDRDINAANNLKELGKQVLGMANVH